MERVIICVKNKLVDVILFLWIVYVRVMDVLLTKYGLIIGVEEEMPITRLLIKYFGINLGLTLSLLDILIPVILYFIVEITVYAYRGDI